MTKKKKRVSLSLKRRTLRRLDSAVVEKVKGGQPASDNGRTTGCADPTPIPPVTSRRTLPTQF